MKGQGERLNLLIELAGYKTLAEFARKVPIEAGTLRQQVNRNSVPKDMAEKYIRKAAVTGATIEWLLYGKGPGPQRPDLDRLRGQVADVQMGSRIKPPTGALSIIELDVRAAAGAGALVEYEDPVGEWRMPGAVLRLQTRSPEDELRIITATGDSMEPGIPPGTRVLVDTADKKPSPPGVFVVDDGVGIVIKRVQIIPGSDPPAIRLSSDNPQYAPYERTLDEAAILGRVIGRWVWM